MANNKIMAIVISAVFVIVAAVSGTMILNRGINTENFSVVAEGSTKFATKSVKVGATAKNGSSAGKTTKKAAAKTTKKAAAKTTKKAAAKTTKKAAAKTTKKAAAKTTKKAAGTTKKAAAKTTKKATGTTKKAAAKTTKKATATTKKSTATTKKKTTATTKKSTATTKKSTATTKKKSTATTKKKNGNSSENNTYMKKGGGIINAGLMSMEEAQALGYRYNSEGDYFYTDDKDCWQYGFGYNEVYDQAASLAVMYIDDVRIRFDYEGKAWMIQLWKGQYGWVFVGAEIGIYTNDDVKTAGVNPNDINHYNCADKSDWLKMKMDCYWDMDRDGSYEKIFTRPYGYYWWATGFKLGTLNRFSSPIKELKMGARITFKTEKMATLFTKGMKTAGFSSASSAKSLGNDTIFQNGKDVYFLWHKVYAETYVEYERTTNKKTKTTTAPKTTAKTEIPTVPSLDF